VFGIFFYLCFSENGLVDLLISSRWIGKNWLLFALLSLIAYLTLDVFLIYLLSNGNSNHKYSFKDSIKTSFVGHFFSAITPSATGGQAVQVFVMSRYGIHAATAISILVQKFLVFQIVATMYSATSMLIETDFLNNKIDKTAWFFVILGVLVQAFIIIAILIFSFCRKFTKTIIESVIRFLGKIKIIKKSEKKIEKLENKLLLFYEGNKKLFKNKPLLLATYLLTFLQLACFFIVPYFVYRSFYFKDVGFLKIICIASLVHASSYLLPTPGSTGVAEAAGYALFSPLFSDNTIKPALLIFRLITYYLIILISFPFSRLAKKKERKNAN
jgi:uncharacterized protein (TIRG00374 family)